MGVGRQAGWFLRLFGAGPTAWTRWRRARRLRAFHRRCDRLRIPDDVRVRLLKASNKAPDWYAGRRSA